jgi:chorismate mutase
MPADLDALAERLDTIAEELADLALHRLRIALDAGEAKSAEERRITRARRAVEKASGLLRDRAGQETDED